ALHDRLFCCWKWHPEIGRLSVPTEADFRDSAAGLIATHCAVHDTVRGFAGGRQCALLGPLPVKAETGKAHQMSPERGISTAKLSIARRRRNECVSHVRRAQRLFLQPSWRLCAD